MKIDKFFRNKDGNLIISATSLKVLAITVSATVAAFALAAVAYIYGLEFAEIMAKLGARIVVVGVAVAAVIDIAKRTDTESD